MKVGTEDKRKVMAGVILAAVAVLLFIRMMVNWGGPVTAATPAPAAVQGPPAMRVKTPARGKVPAGSPLDPTVRLGLLKASEDMAYTGTGRNIFRQYEPPPPQPVTPVIGQQQDTCNPPHPGCPNYQPPPPPINLQFYGFANNPGEPRRIFLKDGDSLFIAKEGDIVNRRYKVLRITQNSVDVEDVLNNNRQTIPLLQQGG